MIKVRTLAMCGAGAWALLAAGGVAAQTTPAVAPADQQTTGESAASAGIDEILVTARRRSEGLMDVPVTVSALSGGEISKYNPVNLSQIGDLIPTVIISSYKVVGGGSLAIRGISSPATQVGFEQAVSVSIDGVQTSNGRVGTLGFFDLAQVEVLKGPQALYFGKNSSAGVISLTSAGPTDSLEFGGKATYEFVGDEAIIESYVAGPLTPTLGGRLAVRYRNLKGWMYNDALPIANPFYTPNMPASLAQLPGRQSRRFGEEEIMGRLTLVFDPGSDFNATLKVFGVRQTDQGGGSAVQNIGPCPGGKPNIYGIVDPFGECRPDNHTSAGAIPTVVAAGFPRTRADGLPYGETDVIFSTLNMNLDLGPVSLVSTSGYSRFHNYGFSGFDSSVYSQLAYPEENREWAVSQEFRASGDIVNNLSFMAGLYGQITDLNAFNASKIRDSGYNAAAGKFENWDAIATLKGRTVSAFGELQWKFMPGFELSGGLRWTKERRRFRKENQYGIGGNDTLNTVYPGPRSGKGFIGDEFNDTNFSPEVTLTYHPARDSTIYAAYKTGFKSGGYALSGSLAQASTIADFDFGSETARGFEIGAKANLFDRKLRITSALFAYKFRDLQVSTYDASTVTFKINNAGAVVQRGGEIEANLDVGGGLSVRGALTYVHNRFRDYVGQCFGYAVPAGQALTAPPPSGCSFVLNSSGGRLLTAAGTPVLQQDFGGRAPPRSPDVAASTGFAYIREIGDGLKLGFNGDAFFSGKYYAGDTEAPSTLQHSFWRFNAGVRLSGPDDRWEIAAIGRNLTNKYYLLFAGDLTGGTSIPLTVGQQRGVVSRGRELSIQLNWKFN